jgi:hypothetical protein
MWNCSLTQQILDKKIHEARAFNFTYRYIDDVLSINNSRWTRAMKRFALSDISKEMVG